MLILFIFFVLIALFFYLHKGHENNKKLRKRNNVLKTYNKSQKHNFIRINLDYWNRGILDRRTIEIDLEIKTEKDLRVSENNLKKLLDYHNKYYSINVIKLIPKLKESINRYKYHYESNFYEQERKNISECQNNIFYHKGSIGTYKINTIELTCTCFNWKEDRSIFNRDNPKRLCKHLLKFMNINELPPKLFKYKEDFQYYKDNFKGFNRQFKKIIKIPSIDCTILLDNVYEWTNVYKDDGTRFAFITKGAYNHVFWTKNTPIDEKTKDTIKEYLGIMENKINPLVLSEKEISEIKRRVLAKNIEIELSLTFVQEQDCFIYELSANPLNIIGFDELLEEWNRNIKTTDRKYIYSGWEYMNTINVKKDKIDLFLYFSRIQFNRKDGQIAEKYFHEEILIPDFLPKDITFPKENYVEEINQEQKTKALNIVDIHLEEPLELVKKERRKKLQTPKGLTKREQERQEWLKDVFCPICNGKNIHKKGKRKYKNHTSQRYQCQDCVKIFSVRTIE